MTHRAKNIVVVGQGAIGLLWYHHLSKVSTKQKTKVTLLASNQEALIEQGISIRQYQFADFNQQASAQYSLTYTQPADIAAADIVLLCLKSYKITEAIKSLTSQLPSTAMIILAHNGMGTAEEVIRILPDNQVILTMLTTHGCLRHEPFNVTHTGLGQSDIGLVSGELSTNMQDQLTEQLNSALPKVTFHQDIYAKQWLKLAINCVINPITAINDIDNGEVTQEKFMPLMKTVLTEITKVSKAEGITLDIEELLAIVIQVAQATANNCSSMRCDVLAKQITEIDFINGYIHRLGEKHGIATPENSQLWQHVNALKS